MKPIARVTFVATLLFFGSAPPSVAEPLGTSIPGNCVEHTSFNGGDDVAGDYRCAGMALDFHTAGVGSSPYPIWAGQWLFVDPSGNFRVGSCTFNRGIHPTILSPAQWVGQSLPNDPTGALSAYLAWQYGDTTDNLTAAALWALFHYYAQDAAGPNRSSDPNAPLIPTLGGIAAASGRSDVESLAQSLHAEATSLTEQWVLTLAVGLDGVATATLMSGANPVPNQEISVLVSGLDVPLVTITSADGTATVTVSLPPGTVTVVATASAPGPADVYRGEPATDDGHGGQNLITGGASRVLRAEASVTVPTTTTSTTTATTTTIAPTTTSTTEPPTTTAAETTTTTTYIAVADPTTTSIGTGGGGLPRTGGERDSAVAYIGTAFVVGGIGLMGTLRRRRTAA